MVGCRAAFKMPFHVMLDPIWMSADAERVDLSHLPILTPSPTLTWSLDPTR